MRLIEQGFIETPHGTKHYRIVETMLNNIPHYEWQYHIRPFTTLEANGSSGMAKKYGGSVPMQDIVKCYDDLKDHMAYCYDVKRRDFIEARTITYWLDEGSSLET